MQLSGRCRRVQLQTRARGLSIVPRNQVSAGERGPCARTRTSSHAHSAPAAAGREALLKHPRAASPSTPNWLPQNNRNSCLTTLKARNPESRCRKARLPPRPLAEGALLASSNFSLPRAMLWIMAVNPQSVPGLPCGDLPYPSLASTELTTSAVTISK